jgi:hypothetical protein
VTVAKPKPGSGSRPGERRGGRGVGAKNKKTLTRDKLEFEVQAAAVAALGKDVVDAMDPLDIMLFAMRLALAQGWMFKAAAIAMDAAPYCHPRLATTQIVGTKGRKAPEEFSDEELATLAGADLDDFAPNTIQ